MGALATADRPMQGAWPQPTAPLQGGLGCSRPPMQGGWPEIVYPCIPDPDEKMKEVKRPPPSSLVVSTRWISAAKLLQSDLATLAQMEGGE
ncbi:hypothetical protein BHE74_00058716 [Ensete ventricosum]|nr:hypothetical protein BHE74_00058716 [Ensete ventricosum]